MNKIKQLYSKYKTPVLYSTGSLTKALAQLFVGFVIAKYISPDDFGLWTTINLLLTYSMFLQAGFINGLNLELPLASGREESEKVNLLAGSVQTVVLFSSFLFLFIGTLYFLFYPEANQKIKYGVMAMVFVIIFTYYQSYLISTFRSQSSFKILAVIQIVDAFVNIVTLGFVIYFSFYGMIIKSVIVCFVYVLLLHIYRPIKVGLIWDYNTIKTLLKVGLPIFALAMIESFSSTSDRLWLLKFSNINNLGYYSFGFYGYTVFLLFSASIASYIYPKMSYSFGKDKDTLLLWEYVKKITLILLSIQIPLAIIGYFAIPTLISAFFTNYIQSTHVMQILLLAGVFRGSVIGVNALWSMKKWKFMIAYQLIYSAMLIGFTFIGAYFLPNKIEGVAYGILLANVLNLISGIFLVFISTKK